jgi:hypothetical protein
MRHARPERNGIVAAAAFAGVFALAAWVPSALAAPDRDSVDAVAPAPSGPRVWAPPGGAAADSSIARAVGPGRLGTRVIAGEPALELLDRRRDGATTLPRQWRVRWPFSIAALPFLSDAFDRPVSLDAGVASDAWPAPSTDRTTIAGTLPSFGVPNAAATIAVPGPPEGDPFLVDAWDLRGDRETLSTLGGPAEMLAAPEPRLWWHEALRDSGAAGDPTSSALLYERGDRGVQHTGARFAAPGFARGVAGAFTRRASDGDAAFLRALETRYAVAANVTRGGPLEVWVEGALAARRIESATVDRDGVFEADGEAFGEARHLALHARRVHGAGEAAATLRFARVKHTQIDPDPTTAGAVDGPRERGDEPSASLRVVARRRLAPAWSGLLSLDAATGTIRSRAGPAPVFGGVLDESRDIRRRDARAAAGVRRQAKRGGVAWAADAAYDVRDSDRGFLDARLSASIDAPRVAAWLALESAHQRATWEDRFSATRDRGFANILVLPQAVRYRSESDSSLRPRRLSGLAGRAVWTPRARLRLHATASVRYVDDDFGWDVTRTERIDSVFVLERAGRRGSGWNRHVSLGAAWSVGPVAAGAQGWTRGGALGSSNDAGPAPRAGSPARAGLDAALDARAVLFGGDLPLTLGLEAHVAGARRGLTRAPATATLDGSLRADFTDAGLFFRFEDLLDRRPPSGVYDIATDEAVPMPGRRFHFGVIWHLLD